MTLPGARAANEDVAGHVSRFDLHAYIRALEDADRIAAVAVARRCVDRMVPVDIVIDELLAAAQVEIGRRWESGEWSVADEHAASGITAAALTALTSDRPAATRGSIVVAAAEHEWHSLGVRMAAARLAERGWAVLSLGASVPAGDLIRFLDGRRPMALALSCASPMTLASAARTIRAAHAAGVRVLAGGPGFGDSNLRAIHLGADAWAGTIDDAHRIFETWEAIPAPPAGGLRDSEAEALAHLADEVAAQVSERMWFDDAAPEGAQPDRATVVEHGAMIMHVLAAAMLTADDTIVPGFLAWLRRVVAARNAPDGYVNALVRTVRSAISPDLVKPARIDAAIGSAAR